MVGHSQSTITVVVGQRALFREGVAALLRDSLFKVVATAPRASELKELRGSPGSRKLIILGTDDGNGDVSDTSENIKALRSLFPGSKIVVIAEMRGSTNLQQILLAAPDGYIANLSSRDVLLKLLDVALLDQQVIVLSRPMPGPPSVGETEPHSRINSGNLSSGHNLHPPSAYSIGSKNPKLSQRERQILVHLAEGESNKQIARLCNITESTVKVHLKAILRKITAHNRTQAAIWAVANGYQPISASSDDIIKERAQLEQSLPAVQIPSSTKGNGTQILHVDAVK
jgi:two-component system nitrate/nitrite response regulator NarL